MLIAQLTDTHILSPEQSASPDANQRLKDLELCIANINMLVPLPDAVIHTGDMTQSATKEEYEIIFHSLQKLKAPFFPVPGNRDSKTLVRQTFFPENNITITKDGSFLYEINHLNVRLIGLDSCSTTVGLGFLCKERLETLDKMLSTIPNKPTVIFMHHPPIPVETPSGPRFEFVSEKSAQEFLNIISKYNQICRVFCGHSHRPFINSIGKIEISTVPSIATDLRRGEYPMAMEKIPVYQLHSLIKTKKFVSQSRLLTKIM